MTEPTLSNLLHENRRFEPPDDSPRRRISRLTRTTRRVGPAEVVGEAGGPDRLGRAVHRRSRLEQRAVRQVGSSCKLKCRTTVSTDTSARTRRPGRIPLEGEPADARTLTYAELLDEVSRAAKCPHRARREGRRPNRDLHADDPETVVAMLACAGSVPRTRSCSGFSSQALQDRILDCDARIVITADGGYRRGAASALKPAVDAALEKCPDVRNVLVVRRTAKTTSSGPRAATSGGTSSSAAVERARAGGV